MLSWNYARLWSFLPLKMIAQYPDFRPLFILHLVISVHCCVYIFCGAIQVWSTLASMDTATWDDVRWMQWELSEIIRIHVSCKLPVATMWGHRLFCSELSIVWLVFKGSDYSRAASIQGWWLFKGSIYSKKIQCAKEQKYIHEAIHYCSHIRKDGYLQLYLPGDSFPSSLHETVEIHCIFYILTTDDFLVVSA